MEAFESLVAMLLRHQGYWVAQSFKVLLNKTEKRQIGTATMPRLELDLVAYKAESNEILIIECKSYLDSVGVRLAAFDGTSARYAKRYKLFNRPKMAAIVRRRLAKQLKEEGACRRSPKRSDSRLPPERFATLRIVRSLKRISPRKAGGCSMKNGSQPN